MLNKAKIVEIARTKGPIKSRDLVIEFNVSRQYVVLLINELLAEGKLLKIGSTRNALYFLPEYAKKHPDILPSRFSKRFANKDIKEEQILAEIEEKLPQIGRLSEHVQNIFVFAFSEMLNNAIEHSRSEYITVDLSITDNDLLFVISDFGIGVFRNVMHKKGLHSELEAIQDILKGKTTTMPQLHSGQGIFFTSKAADVFVLDSFDQELLIDNKKHNIDVRTPLKRKRGTRVIFRINTQTHRHLSDVFKKYTNLTDESDYGFDKTEVRVKFYAASGVNISRSQARRILHGLDKFKVILLDYNKVPLIGQAFADEIYRVFQNKHADIVIQDENTNEAVEFMIKRAKADARN
jgi:anti-sigma regulatory factor (Ser/Thr protein kinase)